LGTVYSAKTEASEMSRIAADSTMLRMVNRLMALSLGVHREQLLHRMGLTWPRPFLFPETGCLGREGCSGPGHWLPDRGPGRWSAEPDTGRTTATLNERKRGVLAGCSPRLETAALQPGEVRAHPTASRPVSITEASGLFQANSDGTRFTPAVAPESTSRLGSGNHQRQSGGVIDEYLHRPAWASQREAEGRDG
jgi:hypothetical protein